MSVYGYKATACWFKNKNEDSKNQFASKTEEEEALLISWNENQPLGRVNAAESSLLITAFATSIVSKDEFCLDSGATSYMCSEERHFSKITAVSNETVRSADSGCTEIKGKGTVAFSPL